MLDYSSSYPKLKKLLSYFLTPLPKPCLFVEIVSFEGQFLKTFSVSRSSDSKKERAGKIMRKTITMFLYLSNDIFYELLDGIDQQFENYEVSEKKCNNI